MFDVNDRLVFVAAAFVLFGVVFALARTGSGPAAPARARTLSHDDQPSG
jgi:hypothetical protein